MFNESPRLTKLIAGGLTALAMGVGGVALADDGQTWPSNPQGPPPGQVDNTHDRGWRCDDNQGVGYGNPAHPGRDIVCPPKPPVDNPPTVVEPTPTLPPQNTNT